MKNIHDGDRVRARLAQVGMTQKELAVRIGVAGSTLSRMLNEASWRTDYLKKAGEILDANFFDSYHSIELEGGPVLGIILKPDSLNDLDVIKRALDQFRKMT